METIITTQNVNLEQLSLQVQKIEIMKWLLDLEYSDKEYSLEQLQNNIDELCYGGFGHLVLFHHYLTEMPKHIKKAINKIIDAKDNREQCKQLYINYLKNYKRNLIFKEYETYILMQKGSDALKDVPDLTEENFMQNLDKIKSSMLEQKRIELGLIFNILTKTPNLFRKKDFLANLPQLIYWIQNNIDKPIHNLENDDCEILSAYMGSLSYDDMLNCCNFSSFTQDYADIYKRIQAMPAKFGVQNMTQVMFRILLLKPIVWRQACKEEVVKAIKGICNDIQA